MELRNPIPFALLMFSLAAGAPALAQSNSPSSSSVSPSEQSTTQTPAPVADALPESASKKVWTNDDMTDVAHGPTPAKPPANTAKVSATKAAVAPKTKSSQWYRDQIVKLQAQLPLLESQISELQAALSGEAVSETRKYGGVKLDDWSVELKQLQQKRDDIFAKIAVLEDQARHDGVAPNSLP
jgi:hypothetical protein